MEELKIKSKVLKDLISFMKGKEKDTWAEVLDEGGEAKPESKEEEECECEEGEECDICKKPKGMAIVEETVIVGKPKK